MMRGREIRGYNRYVGVTTRPSSRLRAAGVTSLVSVGVVGLCGLTTLVAQQTDRLEASKVSQAAVSDANTTAIAKTDTFSAQPATMLQTIAVPAKKMSAPQTTKQESAPCDESLRNNAKQKKSENLKKESVRHRHELRSLQTTGFITKFFNPSLYGRRLEQETTRHKNAAKYIHNVYAGDLKKAHC